MNLFATIITVGAGPVVGAALIGLITGLVLGFVFYSPEARALSKLDQIIRREEEAMKATVFKERSRFTNEFARGVNHLLDRLKGTIAHLKG